MKTYYTLTKTEYKGATATVYRLDTDRLTLRPAMRLFRSLPSGWELRCWDDDDKRFAELEREFYRVRVVRVPVAVAA